MKLARVNVIQSALVDGVWHMPGISEMNEADARQLAARGYVEILSVDGAEEVYAPCCGSHD